MIGSTIIVEDRLKELFDYLPEMTSDQSIDDKQTYKPIFESGLESSLLDYIMTSENEKIYPLIWLAHPYTEDHERTKRVKVDLDLVLAVKTIGQLLSSQRMELTFKPILYPLADNILNAFTYSNIIDWSGRYKITKFENYGNAFEKTKQTFLWDAIKLNCEIEINSNCLRPIYYG